MTWQSVEDIPIIILDTEENLFCQLATRSPRIATYIGPPAEVGTLLKPYTPVVGFSSSFARLTRDLSPGLATTSGSSTTVAAVEVGRTNGGVVVIASGPSWATVTAFDLDARGGREFVISPVGCMAVLVEMDRMGDLVGALIDADAVDGDSAEGEAFTLDSSPRSLKSQPCSLL